jgi:hypothetical protein
MIVRRRPPSETETAIIIIRVVWSRPRLGARGKCRRERWVGYGVVEKSELFNCMSMETNGGLNDCATALNTDGEWCRLRELEEGKRVNLKK